MNSYFIIILILFIICILTYCIYDNKRTIEHYCYIPKYNSQGVPNNFNVYNSYKPQSNIKNSGCDNYWKNWSMESNSIMVTDEPIPISSDQLKLPPTSQFGNRSYATGLIDYKKLVSMVNDPDKNYFKRSQVLNLNPLTKEKVPYYYQVEFSIIQMNKKTDKQRWTQYSPSVMTTFKYEDIASPIMLVNELNLEFQKRINNKQQFIVSKRDKLIYGIVNFQIIYYKILNIMYLDNNKDIPVYIMQIGLFQEKNYYIPTFSYIGLKLKGKLIIVQAEYVGVNANQDFLLPDAADNFENQKNFFVLNQNFNSFSPRITNSDYIVDIENQMKDAHKLVNQYACFNINIDNSQDSAKAFLPYYSRQDCESTLDPFGRPKAVGVYDKPCKEDKECPFFQSNKNYPNKFGGCVNNKCQLPLNMTNIGYHYYVSDKTSAPLCYNCNNNQFDATASELGNCCHEQFDKKKYPFLKSPDYAFTNDELLRKNYDLQTNFVIKGKDKFQFVPKKKD
jgi:hypothetical protein